MRPLTIAARIPRNSRGQERPRDREQERTAATATGAASATATGDAPFDRRRAHSAQQPGAGAAAGPGAGAASCDCDRYRACDCDRQGFSRGLPFPVALHQHPCCTAATPKGPQYCSFLVAQAPRGIHSTRLLLFQRNGTDEGVPSGAASAAGGANWTVASEIAAFGATQLGDMCSVPL